MIKSVEFRKEKGRIFADIVRDSIVEGEKIYIGGVQHPKYLPSQGLSATIDLTAYMRAELTGTLRSLLNGLSSGEVRYYNRYNLSIIPQIESEEGSIYRMNESYFDGVRTDYFGLLTLLPYMQVAEGDSVIVCAQCGDDDTNSVSVGNATSETFNTGDYGVVVTSISPATTAKNVVLNSAVGYDEYRNSIPLRTIAKGMNTRRLIWRNELGGIDSWYFEFLRESNYATTSEVFYSSTDGYTRTNRKSERLHTVETRELDDLTAEVVAYVIASPEVYLVEGNDLVPIDIITEECRTYSDTELSGVQVSYRKRKRE